MGGDKLKIDVSYKLVFSPNEAGKQFKVAISLFGEDKAGDDEPAGIAPNGPQPLYTFGYGLAGFSKKFKIITAQAGEQSVTEPSREIAKETLNEDPGVTQKVVQGTVVKHPHADEIYAVVSVHWRRTLKHIPVDRTAIRGVKRSSKAGSQRKPPCDQAPGLSTP